jgi:tetratricopeptide (TPR) repeat protein
MERYEEAIAAQKKALARSPDHLGIHLVLATIYSELGREEEARAHVAEALRTNPHLSLEVFRQRLPYKDQAVLERLGDILRKAGLK